MHDGLPLLLRQRDLVGWVAALRRHPIFLVCQQARLHLVDTLLVVLQRVLVIKILQKRARCHLKIVDLLQRLWRLDKIGVGSMMSLAAMAIHL